MKTTVLDHLKYIELVEDVFGIDWLEARVKDMKRTGRPHWNYLPRIWEESKALILKTLAQGNKVGYRNSSQKDQDNICFLTKFGEDLSKVHQLPHFQSCILQKLKKSDS